MTKNHFIAFNLARLVTSHLDANHISINDFAERMGICKETAYNSYVLGNCGKHFNPRLTTIIALSEALKLDYNLVFQTYIKDRKEFAKKYGIKD